MSNRRNLPFMFKSPSILYITFALGFLSSCKFNSLGI